MLRDQGVVGDVCGLYFSEEGKLLDVELHQRRIGIIPDWLLTHYKGVRAMPTQTCYNCFMARLIRLSLLLVWLFASSAVLARSAGGAQASPAAILFTAPDGAPCEATCLLGVEPGVTSYLDANRILRAHPLVSSQYTWERAGAGTVEIMGTFLTVSLISDGRGRLATISVHLQPDRSGISESAVDVRHGAARIGDAILQLGPPGLIQVSHNESGLTRMFYPERGFVTTSYAPGYSPTKRLGFADELSYVGLAALDWYREAWHGPMLTATAWHGFGSVRRYFGRWR